MATASGIYSPNGELIKFQAQEETGTPDPTHEFWYTPFENLIGSKATPTTAQKIATVYACVNVIARTVAMFPAEVFRKQGKRNIEIDHPLKRVLKRRPNRLMCRYQFWQFKERSQLLWGNFYAQIIRNRLGDVTELIPLLPQYVTVEAVSGEYDIRYRYDAPGEQSRYFSREEIFHTKDPGDDGIVGRSRIKVLAELHGLGLAMQAHNTSFVQNNARPSGILIPSEKIDKEQRDKLRESWQRAYGGSDNAGKVAIVPFGVDFKQIHVPAKDAQLLELLEFTTVDEIIRVFDVPPYRVQDFRRATFTNVTQADIFWGKNTLAPHVANTESEIEFQLLQEGEEDISVRFNMDSIFRADIKTRYEAHGMAIKDGWLSRNEVRRIEDWNEEDGLEEYLVPLNMITVDDLRRAREKESVEGAPAPEPEQETESQDDQEMARKFERIIAGILDRMMTKEVNATKRALKRADFVKAVNDFFDKHFEHIEAELSPVMEAMQVAFSKEQPDWRKAFRRAYLETRAELVLSLANGVDEERQKEIFERWRDAEHWAKFLMTGDEL